MSGVASGQPSTDPISADDARPPDFRRRRDVDARTQAVEDLRACAGAAAADDPHCRGGRGRSLIRTQVQRGEQSGREGLTRVAETVGSIRTVVSVSTGFHPSLHILTDLN